MAVKGIQYVPSAHIELCLLRKHRELALMGSVELICNMSVSAIRLLGVLTPEISHNKLLCAL